MAGLLDTRLAREEASIFDDLYAAARQQEAALAEQGRRSVLGGLFSKEPVQGIDTVRFEGMPGLLSMLTPAAKAVDAPISAYRGLIPEQDMLGEAMGTAGLAMGGGGVAAGRNIGATNANASKSAGLLAASLPDPRNAGEAMAKIPVGSKVYRQDSLKPNYAGEGAVYYTPDKTYTENYASDGRVLKTATVPDSIVDTYTDFGRAKALNWIKGQYDEYSKLSTSGELTRITPELKYISKILDKETTSAQDIAQAMANLNLIYGKQTGKNNSSAAEKRFLDAVDADAITGWESNGVPSIAFRNAPAANASPLTGLMAMQAQPQPDLAAEIRAYLESIQ